ncbi:MAG: hypothetical protein V4737_10190 [Curtobacterium sp.]
MADLHELGTKRGELLDELERVTEEIRPVAVRAVREGAAKFYVARDARVTRRTLDQWIADSAGDGTRASSGG